MRIAGPTAYVQRIPWDGSGEASEPIGLWMARGAESDQQLSFPLPSGAVQVGTLSYRSNVNFRIGGEQKSGLYYNVEQVMSRITLTGPDDDSLVNVSEQLVPPEYYPSGNAGVRWDDSCSVNSFGFDPAGEDDQGVGDSELLPVANFHEVVVVTEGSAYQARRICQARDREAPTMWVGRPVGVLSTYLQLDHCCHFHMAGVNTGSSLAVTGDYRYWLAGYVWDAGAINAPGGPRRPARPLFG